MCYEHVNYKQKIDDKDPWTGFLSSIAWDVRLTIHVTLDAAPAELVFARGMMLPMAFKAGWERILSCPRVPP